MGGRTPPGALRLPLPLLAVLGVPIAAAVQPASAGGQAHAAAVPWAWSGAFNVEAGYHALSVERNASGDYPVPSTRLCLLALPAGAGTPSGLEAATGKAERHWLQDPELPVKSGDLLDVGKTYRLEFDARAPFSYYVVNALGAPLALFTEHPPVQFEQKFSFFRTAQGTAMAPATTGEQPPGDHDHDHAGGDHDHDHTGGDHDHDLDHDHDHDGDGGDHDHGPGGHEVWIHVSKVLGIVAITASGIVGVVLRLRCPWLDSPTFFGYVSVLSGGMFIAMALFHILPEAIIHQPPELATLMTEEATSLAIMTFVFIGFTLVLFFERVLFDAHGDGVAHREEEEAALKDALNPKRSFIARASLPGQSVQGLRSSRGSLTGRRASGLGRELELSAVNGHEHSERDTTLRPGLAPGTSVENLDSIQEGGHGHGHMPSVHSLGHGHGDDGHSGHHGHGGGHAAAHDHGHHMPAAAANGTGAILLMAALSVHSVFEGLLVGTSKQVITVWILVVVIVAHKWAEAFAIANQLTEGQRRSNTACVLLTMFTLAIPVGVAIGWVIDALGTKSSGIRMVESILNSLAVGTLLYIGMVEVVPEEFTGSRNAVRKFVVFIISAAVIFGLTLVHVAFGHAHEEQGHDEGGGHDHTH